MNLFFKFFYPKIEILLCPFVSTPFINPETKWRDEWVSRTRRIDKRNFLPFKSSFHFFQTSSKTLSLPLIPLFIHKFEGARSEKYWLVKILGDALNQSWDRVRLRIIIMESGSNAKRVSGWPCFLNTWQSSQDRVFNFAAHLGASCKTGTFLFVVVQL